MQITLEALRAIVGPAHVLTGDDVHSRRVDWMTGAPCQAGAIVRPADTEQVAAVMQTCYAVQQPVVTHGGLTGLVHGAEASPDELVTIGGNIATNAGGVRVIRYGMMRQQVLGLEAVMADGRVVSSMNHMLKNNAGFDLKQLFIGSEGTLGIVTRAVLRLQPPTPSEQTAMVACPSFEALTGLLSHMGKALGGGLGAFEVMWQNHYRLLTETLGRHTPPIATEHPFYVIIDSLGSDAERNANQFSEALESALESELIVDAVIAQSTTQRDGLWAIREDIEGLVKGLAPVLTFDVSLPIADMQRYTDALEAQLTQRWAEAKLVVFGHLGDGNLHISVSVGSAEIEVRREVEAMVYQPLATLGGSVSAEHGIGQEKRPWLSTCRSSAEIELMHTLKQALDPLNLLNRGKVLQ